MPTRIEVCYKGFHATAPVVDHRPEYNNFLLSDRITRDPLICFSYREKGRTVQKVIPTMSILGRLRKHSFYKYDEEKDRLRYNGSAYIVPDKLVFEFKE